VIDLLEKVWPIFAAETREGLRELADGVMDLEHASSADAVASLRRIAHTIKGSAASLGVDGIERTAHAIEDVLALADDGRLLSAEAVGALLGAVRALEDSLAPERRGRIDALQEVIAALEERRSGDVAPEAAPAGERPAEQQPAAWIEELTAAVGALCLADGAERDGHAARARALAEQLGVALPGRSAEAARRIAATMAGLASGGDLPRAIASAAADVVELRTGGGRAQGPDAEPPPVAAPVEQSIRVESGRLDSVAADVDLIVVGVSARERRGRELERMEESLRDAVQRIRTGLAEARIRDDARPRGISEGLERLRGVEAEFARHAREARREAEREGLIAHGLRDALQDLRMVPAQTVLSSLRQAARETAARLGKKVRFVVRGGEVRLDRRVLEDLKGPLLHLVRNGIDHGIEAPEARAAAGKPAEATLEVRVDPRGDRVVFTVRDDGAGISPDRLRAVAVQRGLMTAVEAGKLSDAEAARIAFQPGISTASEITSVSGRGVGLDVVAEAVRRLGGTVDVSFERGAGTTFSLEAPLAMTGTAGLLFRAAGGLGLLPLDAVESVLLVRQGEVGTIAGRAVVTVEGVQVPYTSLAQVLGTGAGPTATETTVALLVSSVGRRAAVAVDEVLGEHPMVVAPLGKRMASVRWLAGAAVLDDGRVVSVLSPAELVGAHRVQEGRAAAPRSRIIVADDSLSTRAAAKSILEIAGFAVITAADGQEALELAREGGCDLIVSDVQMPRMDGLELTRRVKADPKLAGVPVILVTSLNAPEDRSAGLKAGADGYLVKRDVARGALLDLVRSLLPG
jgi:two-component system chemotaxis sensor kinase CheA